MSDLFNKFTFDLQRFAATTFTDIAWSKISSIKGTSAAIIAAGGSALSSANAMYHFLDGWATKAAQGLSFAGTGFDNSKWTGVSGAISTAVPYDYNITSVSSIALANGAKANFLQVSNIFDGATVTSLKSANVSIGGNKYTFSNNDASFILGAKDDTLGSMSYAVLTSGGGVTVSQGSASGAFSFGVGSASQAQFTAYGAFSLTADTKSGGVINLAKSNRASIDVTGGFGLNSGIKYIAPASGTKAVYFNGGASAVSISTSGGLQFIAQGSALSGVVFGKANDSVNLSNLASVIPDAYRKNTQIWAGGYSVAGFAMATMEGALKLASSVKSGGNFQLSNFATAGNSVGLSSTAVYFLGDSIGGSLDFSMVKGIPTLTAASVISGGGLSLTGLNPEQNISINSGLINVNTHEFKYYRNAASLGGEYLDLSGTAVTDYAGLSTAKGKVAGGLNVASFGNATRIALGVGSTVGNVSVAGTAYMVANLSNGIDTTDAFAKNSFLLDGKKVSGFMFANGGSGTFIQKKGWDSSFAIYDGGTDKTKLVALPTIESDTSTPVAIGKSTTDAYDMTVGYKSTLTGATGAKLEIALQKNSIFANVGYDMENSLFSSVSLMGNPSLGFGSSNTVDAVKGITVTVTGASVDSADKGIKFFGSGSVAFAGGNYIYGIGVGTSDTAAHAISLTSDTDTIYGGGNAKYLFMQGSAGSLTDGSDAGDGAVYAYKSSGNAYFNLATTEAAVSGFTFIDAEDALTLGEGTPTAFALGYKDSEGADTTMSGAPTVSSDQYTITLKQAMNKKVDTAIFELSDLGAEAVATVGSNGATFAFGAESGIITFNHEGNALGLSVATSDATLDSTAAALLAADNDTLESSWFTINGTPVNIDATAANGLIFNADDMSLFGLESGSTIISSGAIEKIYVTGEDSTYTFGYSEDNTAVEFSITTTVGDEAATAPYFTLAEGAVTGFTFMAEDDSITISDPDKLPEDFKFYDGAEDTTGFTAPIVYEDDSKENRDAYTVVKNTDTFSIASLESGNYVEFDKTAITLANTDSDSVEIEFDSVGDLVGINNVETAGDKVKVAGASKAVQFNGDQFVEITGTTASFVYEVAEDETVQISDVYAGSTVKQLPEGTGKILTAGGESGVGDFTFALGDTSTEYVVAGDENDGIEFLLDGTTVSGISGVDNNESVTGAFFGDGAFTFNGESVEIKSASAATQYTFSGASIAGLADDDTVAATSEKVTDFMTAASASGTYTMVDKAFAVEGESDGVTFQFNNGSFSAIAGLDEGATVTGDFTNVIVNGDTIDIEGDTEVYLVGAASGIAKVGGLNGDVTLKDIGEATQLGAIGDGTFTFALGDAASTEDDATIKLEGNATLETTFTLDEDEAGTITVEGMDEGEKLTGWFEEEVIVEGHAIQVYNDEQITAVYGASGVYIEGLTGGASVAKADGITLAKTEAVSGSAAFTFANGTFNVIGQDDGVDFVLDGQAKVVGISGLDDTATVTGDLNGILINGKEPAIQVVGISGPNTNLTYENGILTGLVDGDTVISADNVEIIRNVEDGTFTFGDGQKFQIAGDSSVDFKVNAGEVAVTAIAELAEGATVKGQFENIIVNGDTINIEGDNDVYLVGAASGISKIGGLSGEVTLKNIGEAIQLGADGDGTFTFELGDAASTEDDASITLEGNATLETTFTLGEDEEGTGALIVEGMDEGEKLTTWFQEEIVVQGHAIQVYNDEQITAIYGASSVAIEGLTGGASIAKADGVLSAKTDAISGESAATFTFANGTFEVAGQDDGLEFALDGSANIVGISGLDKDAMVTGKFDDIQSVNGVSFAVTDNDGILTIVGNTKGIQAIAGVNGDAQIDNVGGASFVQTISDGVFTFAGHSNPFVVAGDSAIGFQMDPTQAAKVVGITDFGDQAPAAITGEIAAVAIDGVGNIDVTGDADGILSYAIDEAGVRTLGEVGGEDVAIKAVGGASTVDVIAAGKYAFPSQKYELSADTATFGMNGDVVTSISNLDGEVMGDFQPEGFTVNGKKLQIAGDSTIIAIGGASGVEMIGRLCDGAQIVEAEGVKVATTASDGTFTFKDGREITIAGDSKVTFELDGDGNLVAIGDLEDAATVSGNLNGLAFGGSSSVINVQADDLVLTYFNGTLSGVVPAHTVLSADGATMVAAAGNGSYQFGSGSTAQVFEVSGDSGIIGFRMASPNVVDAITELDPLAEISGPINGLTINNGEAINVVGDSLFGAVAGTSGLMALTKLGGNVTVSAADGAKVIQTDTDGTFKILDNSEFTVSNDADGVLFGLDDNNKVNSILGVEGQVAGDFSSAINVNTDEIQVTGDEDGIIVTGDGAGVTNIDDVDAGATVVNYGSATQVGAAGVGQFTFGSDSATAQMFANTGDDAFNFVTGASGVTGINSFENGTFTFDTNTSALAVNDAPLTFETTTDVTLTIENSQVVGVSGVTGSVSGLGTATVNATGPITVNGKELDITDADSSFKVEVAGGEVTKATGVTGAATVNVESGTFETDTLGAFNIGGENFTFNDEDGHGAFTTNADKKLTTADSLVGTVVDEDGAGEFTLNGDLIGYNSTTPVTIATNGSDITAVDGLASGAAVYGAVDNASIAMAGTSSTLPVDASELNVNGDAYVLMGDADGVTMNGSHQVVGLDNNASLAVGTAGNYTVNGVALEDLEVGDVIVGSEDGTDAYVYDPENILVRKNTPVSEIEDMLGLPNYEDAPQLTPPPVGPLTAEEVANALANMDTNQPMEIWTTNKDERTPQDLNLAGSDFTKKVHLYDGPQNVTFNDDFGNMAIVEDGGTGEKNITFGNGGNVAIIDSEAGLGNEVNITGGTGEDTYYIRDNVAVNIDMGGANGSADKLVTFASANARVALSNYDPASGAGIKIDERKARDIAGAIGNGFISFGEGTVEIGTSPNKSIIDVGQTNGGTLVNLFNPSGEKQVVGFTGAAGGAVGDASTNEDQILIGNQNGNKTGGSTLNGGGGNDTAFGGAGDVLDLGAGNNVANLQDLATRGSAQINITAGRTDIYGANSTLDEIHGDVLGVDLTAAGTNISFDGTNLIVESANFYAVVHDADKAGTLTYDLAESADEAVSDLKVTQDKYTNQIINSNGDIWRGSFGTEGSVMQVEVDEDIRANYYKGENSGVTFAGYTGNVFVDLSQEVASVIDDRVAVFDGINSLKAGTGQSNSAFKGSANSETLMAGQGYASLYGDGGNNLLVGYNGTDGEKEGYTTFMVLGHADGAANTISGFEFVSDNNYTDTDKVTADRLEVDLNTNHFDSAALSGNDVVITVKNNNSDALESVIIKDAANRDIRINNTTNGGNIVAQVGDTSLTLDKYATYYKADGKNATLNIDSGLDTAVAWLDGTKGKEFVGDFAVIDARNSSAKAELAGNTRDNTIYAGSGETSLWGGAHGDDVMYGGTGKDTFYYAYGNGTDVVNGAGNGDIVNLAGMSLDQLASTEFGDNAVAITFKDGGKLTVNDGGAEVAFVVDGSTYYADRTAKDWVKKA